ncbi:Calponin-2 [Saguinus oedipus]|uniref:Calponin-2 n=1 Tax=Saguinus oedipus TaxID=9490 RepID=A0ABQ9TEP4_SAGOE|nr:Calponin-2 [Saguinus oedipus]
MKATQCVIGLQMGTNKCASQSSMTVYGTRRHLYDPKNHNLPLMDHSTISLQMGTNKSASQVGMTAPGMQRHIYDTKLGTDKCDNSSTSLQKGYTQGTNQSDQVLGLGQQIYDPKYFPQSTVANGAPSNGGNCRVPEYPLTTRRKPDTEAPSTLSPHIVSPSGFLGFSVFSTFFS